MKLTKSMYQKSIDDSFFDLILNDRDSEEYSDDVCTEKMIIKMFKHYYENCKAYKEYCDRILTKSHIDEIISDEKIDMIPQIPSAIFKSMDVYCGDDASNYFVCKSSGTRGNVSKIYRDSTSILRTVRNIDFGMKNYVDIWPKDMHGFILGPNVQEAGDLWFAYIISLLNLVADVDYYITNGQILFDKLISDLEKPASQPMAIISPPAIIMHLIGYLKKKNMKLSLPDDAYIFTAGGWKSAQNVSVDTKIFYSLIETYLGVKREKCSDFYNQVEMNTVIMECEEKHKHIPSWMKVIIRDPVTFKPVEHGCEGIITYYDSSAQSYPAFIITDDMGVLYDECKCGIKTPYLKITRRVNTVEQKGCAMKIDMNVVNSNVN